MLDNRTWKHTGRILFTAFGMMLLTSAVARGVVAQQAERQQAERQQAREAKQSWPAPLRRAFEFENATAWRGGTFVRSPRRSGTGAMQWSKHTKNPSLECALGPLDLSAFNVMSFWLHSNTASDGTFMVILPSTREKGVNSYFANKVTVDWTGWKKVELHFRSFHQARQPEGWQHVDLIRFTASGWEQRPTDEPVWVVDDLDFEYSTEPYHPPIHVKKYATEPKPAEFLARLRPEHPRLILLDDQLPGLRQFVTSDERGKAWYERAKAEAERLYKRPVRKHELPDGRRLLSVSRDVVNRIYHWGFFYRLEGDRKWLDRAWQEMQAVVEFPDWNPSHYLDTAEMMHALAIGYDWFYQDLTPAQRKTIRDGLWQHGLRLSYGAYLGLDTEGQHHWPAVTNNWNFVCNGGTSLAAMAVLDEMPEQCGEILHLGYQYIQIPLEHFEPDGAWWEGLGYWGYSVRYFVPYLRGLETAFGTDFGLVDALRDTGFAHAGDFPVYLVSPLGGIYNFADSGSGDGRFQHPHLFYLASRFHNPLYEFFQLRQTSGGLQDLLFYQPLPQAASVDTLPLDKLFRQTEVASMRSSWTDTDAAFVGIKCGANGIAHAHQDLGSFIFSALGEKWLIDLGTERQTYLSHQHHLPKSDFYRIREEGHNTLVFNPDPKFCQDPKGAAVIERFDSKADGAFAVTDLSAVYSQHAQSVQRGFRLLDDRRRLLVQDEIRTGKKSEVWWFAHGDKGTRYELSEDGRSVTMWRGEKRCLVQLLSPSTARLQVMDAAPLASSPNPSIQNPNEGLQKLAIHLRDVSDVTVSVLFSPYAGGQVPPGSAIPVQPLSGW